MKRSEIVIPALFLTGYLSTVLTLVGLDKFYFVLAGGRKFATFPDLWSQLGIGISYVALGVLYLVWFFTTRSVTASRFSQLVRRSLPFLLLAFVSYPLGNDIYLYLHSGLMSLSSLNPFLVRAAAFNSVLSFMVDWGQTSTYGPVSQSLFALSATAMSVSPVLAVYLFKAVCLCLHLLNAYLVWTLLPESDRGKYSLAYLLHPLLLMEQVGSAHVDVLVSTSFLMLAGCLLKQQSYAAIVPLWAGFLSKTIPIIWVPLTGIFLLRQRNWTALLTGIAGSIALALLLWVTVLPGMAWQSLLNPGVTGNYMASIHALVRSGLGIVRVFSPFLLTAAQERSLLQQLTQLTLIGFAGFYAWVALRALRKPTYRATDAIEDIGWVTLVLLLLATSWLMPWYASILVAIAFVIPKAQLFGVTALMFNLSSSAQYMFQGNHSFRSLFTLALPLIVLVIGSRVLEAKPLAQVTESAPTASTAQ